MISKSTILLRFLALTGLCVSLKACIDREVILPGERFDIRAEGSKSTGIAQNTAPRFVVPATLRNNVWPLDENRNLALGAALQNIWSVDLGAGESRKNRFRAQPVFAENTVFAFDALARLNAVAPNGTVLWSRDLTPARENQGDASGNGLAYGGQTLFATTSFGDIYAIDPKTGETRWHQRLDAALVSPPSYYDGVIYFLAGNKIAWALEAKTGRIRWQLDGGARVNRVSQGAAPFVNDKLAVFAYGNGEIEAVFRNGGFSVWSRVLSRATAQRALGTISDIPFAPRVAGETLYVSNISGRIGAYALKSGAQEWLVDIASPGALLPSGNALFFVSDQNQLMRLDRATGDMIWAVDLPYYRAKKGKDRSAINVHYGPILAGGQLVLASSDGLIRRFDPQSGALVSQIEIGAAAASVPVVAQETLYLVTNSGQLRAYR